MTQTATKFIKSLVTLTVLVIMVNYSTAIAQTAAPVSRVAVVANETKTNIWVTDFPKKTSVIVYDNDNNLLSILTTNDFGAAYLSLPRGIKTGVIVKTLDGQISVSNKVVFKNRKEEQNVAATDPEESSKA